MPETPNYASSAGRGACASGRRTCACWPAARRTRCCVIAWPLNSPVPTTTLSGLPLPCKVSVSDKPALLDDVDSCLREQLCAVCHGFYFGFRFGGGARGAAGLAAAVSVGEGTLGSGTAHDALAASLSSLSLVATPRSPVAGVSGSDMYSQLCVVWSGTRRQIG